MTRLMVAVALVLGFAGPAQAGLASGNAASYDGVAAAPVRLAQTAPFILAPSRIDTYHDTVDFAGNVQGVGEVALTANGLPIPVAADGSFRIRQQVPVGRTKLLLVVEDSSGQKAEQGVWIRRTHPIPHRYSLRG